jgi:hypothetical protein
VIGRSRREFTNKGRKLFEIEKMILREQRMTIKKRRRAFGIEKISGRIRKKLH